MFCSAGRVIHVQPASKRHLCGMRSSSLVHRGPSKPPVAVETGSDGSPLQSSRTNGSLRRVRRRGNGSTRRRGKGMGQWRRRAGSGPVFAVVTGFVFLIVMTLRKSSSSSASTFRRLGGTHSVAVPRLSAVLLPIEGHGNIHPPPHVDMSWKDLMTPDFGSIVHTGVMGDPSKIIHGPDDRRLFKFGPEESESLKGDEYYAFDDDNLRNIYRDRSDDQLAKLKHCRRVSFHRDIFPNCNEFHAMDFTSRALADGASYIGGGGYRNVFLYDAHGQNPDLVMKMAAMHLDFDLQNYEFMRMEGSTNALLSPHPLIVDIYGFCSFSMFSEALVLGDTEGKAIPRYERGTNCTDDFDHDKPLSMNDLEPTTKLEWALEMAEAVALLHNYKHGVIVHDDIQLGQFLVHADGHLKMGDFNRAEFMLYDEENHEYCTYRNGAGNGDWRAPEEYLNQPLDEKIDIWSLGVNMYALLTGISPMYDTCKTDAVQRKIVRGESILIHPKWSEKSFAEAQLAEIIQHCFAYKAADRPSIGELVTLLRAAVEENRKRSHLSAHHKRLYAVG